jgi:hypothetical protein
MNQSRENAAKMVGQSVNMLSETETGRTILTSKILALTEENMRLKHKVADSRIAVHALNELAILALRMVDQSILDIRQNHIKPSDRLIQLSRSLKCFQTENSTPVMEKRICGILDDRECEDFMRREIIGDDEGGEG